MILIWRWGYNHSGRWRGLIPLLNLLTVGIGLLVLLCEVLLIPLISWRPLEMVVLLLLLLHRIVSCL